MCGITGYLDLNAGTNSSILEQTIQRMSASLRHRGPDDQGYWIDAAVGIALGFTRLSILDLSPTGHQPMFSADERYVIVFNGEIYNYKSLRSELRAQNHTFRGTSDTEVALAAISQWGIEAALRKFNGMFAIAVWDRSQRSLILARDRLGIKPLYYGTIGKNFLFGSELKALRAHPAFNCEINVDALAIYLRRSCVPAPYSIYQGISKLPPGSFLSIRPGETSQPIYYWQVAETIEHGITHQFDGNETVAIDALEKHLISSLTERLAADVPVGAFLSGGVDSTTLIALAQKQISTPLHTFTLGFHEAGYDEAGRARAIAAFIGTNHTELYVHPRQALDFIPLLPEIYDEPFADSSQIASVLLAHMASQHVKVCISGDGGDELFGGYNRYIWGPSVHRIAKNFPQGLLRIPLPFSTGFLNQILGLARIPNGADKTHKLRAVLATRSLENMYLELTSHWREADMLLTKGREPSSMLASLREILPAGSPAERMMAIDLATYLPDDILVKTDRASMAFGLEVRAPLIDNHETINFAWQLPINMKIAAGQGKWILRQVLRRHIPEHMSGRAKMGLAIPLDSWLRGPLRPWAEELICEKRLQHEGFFNPTAVRTKWNEHLAGNHNWQHYLWDVLMFQAWLDHEHVPAGYTA